MLDTLIDKLKKAVQWIPLPWLRPGRANASGQYLRREKVIARLVGGDHRVRLLPLLDSYTGETEEMRRTYRLMLLDPLVKAALVTKMLAVASLDLQVHPASDRGIDRAAADFVRYCLQHCRGGLRAIALSVLFGGLIDGFSVCEKRHEPIARGRWKGKWGLKQLKAKDTEYLWLVGDEYRNLVSVQDRRTAQEYNPTNFVTFTHLELFSSPLGMSDLRAAYRAYWLRDTAWQLRAVSMERYTLPMLVGTYQVPDHKQELEDAIENARSQSWITVPAGAQVQALQLAAMDAGDFDSAIQRLGEEIVVGITGATLQMLQGQVADGRGSSSVHKATSELLQWYLASEVGDLITDQLVPELVDWNFLGADYPTVSLGGVDDAALAASLAIDTGLSRDLQVELSKEELRKRYGRAKPLNEEDTLRPPPPPGGGPLGVAPGAAGLGAFADGTQPQQTKQPQPPDPAKAQTAANGQSSAVADLQESFYGGKVTREAAVANAQLTLGLSPQQAEALFPAPPKPGAQAEASPADLTLADSGVSIFTPAEKPLSPMPKDGRTPPTKAAEGETASESQSRGRNRPKNGENRPEIASKYQSRDPKAGGPAPATEQVAGPEADADRAEKLLAASRRQGAETLARLTRTAVGRLLAGNHTGHVGGRLFTEEERKQLADALAASAATAELLGRSRVRIRAERARDASRPRKFSDEPTDLRRFAEEIEPLAPLRALLYFRGLVPTLGLDPTDWLARQKLNAFTLAVATEQTLLRKVQDAISQILATGRGAGSGGERIGEILEAAGVAPDNPQYPEMVVRTNALSAYNRGAMEEMRDGEIADLFPAWRYNAITDGRARPAHAARNGNLYASDVDFEDVRGRDISDAANCRCTFTPVSRYEVQELEREAPVEIRRFAEERPAAWLDVPFLPQRADYDCGAACLRMAAAALGLAVPEDTILEGAGTNPAVGTQPEDLAAEARRLGLKASEGLTNERAVAAQLAAGAPVILLIQDGDPAREDGGHYVVARGFGGPPDAPERFYVMDPIDGPWSMATGELLARWHCQDPTGRRDDRTAVAVWK